MASYRYERDIKPEDLIQETPPPLTPAQQRANWWHWTMTGRMPPCSG